MNQDARTDAAGRDAAMRDLIDDVVGIDVAISGLLAARTQALELLDRLSAASSDSLASRSLRAEVACALRLPERTVENLLGEAKMLVRELPATLAAVASGELTYRHAQVMVEHSAGLEPEAQSTFERLAIPVAAGSTPARFDRAARKMRESLDPRTLEARTKAAREQREVVLLPARDGMSDLLLHLPADDAQAIYSRATDRARQLRAEGDPRTVTQLRVDVMRDVLLTGTFDALGGKLVRPDVFVTVPVLSLLGLSDEPATLDGYGPMALSTARELAAHAPGFIRVLTHPETGARLSVGRARYPALDLKNALRARDGTCGMPTCSMPAQFCDIDHTIDWARGGDTRLDNLAYLCRGHHRLKHNSAWRVVQEPNGALRWRSPTGRSYLNHPDGLIA